MESFPVDIDVEQIVRWIMAEKAAAPATFKTTARRATEVREIPQRREFHLGDEEREDLSEVATIATLEIAPAHPGDGWLMTVTVEDEIGPRVSGEETAIDRHGAANRSRHLLQQVHSARAGHRECDRRSR
ncbi:MAG: hypothetical protein WB677_08660 [Xanthobacteraceae bacterium]